MTNPFSKKEKKFSVIIPVYKTWKHLEVNFTYLQEQSYKNFEVICVFDGADKKGEKEIKRLIEKFKNLDIRYLVIKHGGAPKARNAGVPLATGDFYTFLDSDSYLYPDSMREWASTFETHPEIDVVWGLYDLNTEGIPYHLGGGIPCDNSGRPVYWAFRYSNYCSGSFPIRKEAFVGWDESLKSMQDWDMWQRMLLKDNFEGKRFHYTKKPYFITENIRGGGISKDSFDHWLERRKTIMDKNGIMQSDTCVTSYGAPYHGINVARMLGAEYLPDPQWRPHNYNVVYLLGFYCSTNLQVQCGFSTFREFSGKKIIHWIGSDVMQMRNNTSFEALKLRREHFKRDGYIMLSEYQHTHDELEEIGIPSKIVPIPPKEIFEPMPLPKKFTIGIYENPSGAGVYRNEIVPEIAKKFPSVDFKFFGDPDKISKKGNIEHLGYVDMKDLMPKLSCGLRIVDHDGLSVSALEFLTAGRHFITNMDVKYATRVVMSFEAIVEAIRRVRKEKVNPEASKYWTKEVSVKKYFNNINKALNRGNKMYDYKEYWAKREWTDYVYSEEVDMFKKYFKGKSVLDVCCGSGRFVPLAEGMDYHGIDINKKNIEYAKRRYPDKSFEVADVVEWDTDKKYDLVFAYTSIQMIPEEDIKDVVKKLKKWGKKIVLVEPIDFVQTNISTPHDYEKLLNAKITPIEGNLNIIEADGK